MINLNYVWIFIFLFLPPFVPLLFPFFEAGFNIEEAWELAKVKPEPTHSYGFRGEGFASMSKLEALIMLLGFSVIGMVVIMCLPLYFKMMRKRSLKKQKSLANSTLELSPLGENSDGHFFIKGRGLEAS